MTSYERCPSPEAVSLFSLFFFFFYHGIRGFIRFFNDDRSTRIKMGIMKKNKWKHIKNNNLTWEVKCESNILQQANHLASKLNAQLCRCFIIILCTVDNTSIIVAVRDTCWLFVRVHLTVILMPASVMLSNHIAMWFWLCFACSSRRNLNRFWINSPIVPCTL